MPDTLDARGRRCSLLSTMIAERIAHVAPGTVLEVLTDDPGATTEVPSWCPRAGRDLLGLEAAGEGEQRIRIRKGAAS
jgi:tRNA 2-thiouridine synthesizing protein A